MPRTKAQADAKPRRHPIIRTDLAELTPDWLSANLEAPPAEILGKPRRHPIIRTDLAELTPDWLTANLEAPPAEILDEPHSTRVRARNEQQVNGRELARELSRRGIDAPVRTVYNFLDPRRTTMPRAKLFNALVSLAREIAAEELNAAGINVRSRYTDSQIFSMWNTARKGK